MTTTSDFRTKNDLAYASRCVESGHRARLLALCAAVEPDADQRELIVSRPASRNRFLVTTIITGRPARVASYIRAVVESDTCTAMYEHMLTTIQEISESHDDGTMTVKLTENLYAGD